MKKLILPFAAFLLFSFQANATIDSLINSGKCIEKARKLYDSGKYELAVKVLDLIDPRDTNFVYSLSEKANALLEIKRYKEVVEICQNGLKTRSSYRSSLYHSIAIAYTEDNQYEQASISINEGLKEFPFDFFLMYRYGILLYQQGKYDEAETHFFKTIETTPYHSASHLYLSKIAMLRGNKVEGMFAMGIYLALKNQENTQLRVLENFVKNELTDEYTIAKGSSANPFSRLDEIIRAKISFEEEYKLRIPIDAGVVRQFQLLFEQLDNQSFTGESPWIKFYLKIYKDLIKAKAEDPFVYHILQSSSIEKVKQWAEKNEKVLQQFYSVVNNSLNEFKAKRSLPETWGYKKPVTCSYNEEGHLESLGDTDQTGKKTGKWYYYAQNGEKLAEGDYEGDKKVGTWHYSNNRGEQTSIEDYNTDDIKIFNAEGTITQHYTAKDEGVEGRFELFYSCGALSEFRGYHQGKRNGPGKSYFPNGKLKSEFQFKNDSLNGTFTEWYNTGLKESVANYVSGLLQGKYIGYHPNGKIKTIGSYLSGKAEGLWLYYHENGRLRQKGSYKRDVLAGLWETYNERGVLIEKDTYEAREDFDVENDLLHEGVTFELMRLKSDKVVALSYYSKSGGIIATYSSKDGTFKGKGFFPSGALQVELEYEKGVRNGEWKYYSRFGYLQNVNNYTEGMLTGESLEYYSSGTLKIKSNYVNGKLDGLYTEYFANGVVKSIGWYVQGQRQQRWLSYYIDGTIASDMYYLNDVAAGYRLEYSENKKLHSKSEYDSEGRFKSITKYDESGLESAIESTSKPAMRVIQKNHLGGICYKAELSCGAWNGLTELLLKNGKPYKKLLYQNSVLDGPFSTYYPDGIPDGSGEYSGGNPTGSWKWNYFDGSKYSEGRYLGGNRDSVWTFFYPSGKVSSMTNYLNNEKDGETQIFGLDGQLIMVRKYDGGDLVAYKTFTKEGRLSDWINFKGNELVTCYYQTGQLAITEQYKSGQYNGTRKIFYPNGQLYAVSELDNGRSNGEGLTYHPNGKIKQKSFYQSDEANGLWEYFDFNGELIRKETYISGSLCGPVEFYVNGKKTEVQNFFGGFPMD